MPGMNKALSPIPRIVGPLNCHPNIIRSRIPKTSPFYWSHPNKSNHWWGREHELGQIQCCSGLCVQESLVKGLQGSYVGSLLVGLRYHSRSIWGSAAPQDKSYSTTSICHSYLKAPVGARVDPDTLFTTWYQKGDKVCHWAHSSCVSGSLFRVSVQGEDNGSSPDYFWVLKIT